jgi:hypothetical protein
MPEQGKVVKTVEGLKELRSHFRAMAGIASSNQARAGHIESARIIDDAIDLLKRQEPIEVDEWPNEFLCPMCKTRLAGHSHDDCVLLETDDTPNYCWLCGQAVKWE